MPIRPNDASGITLICGSMLLLWMLVSGVIQNDNHRMPTTIEGK